MAFRLAIGPCKCRPPYRDAIQELACHAIQERLGQWRHRLPADLDAVPREQYETERVENHWLTLSTHRHELPDGDSVVAFGVLVHTWWRPTYISLGAIGRLYVEGLLVKADGTVVQAPDEVMWAFR